MGLVPFSVFVSAFVQKCDVKQSQSSRIVQSLLSHTKSSVAPASGAIADPHPFIGL